jgi:hypothetical protein
MLHLHSTTVLTHGERTMTETLEAPPKQTDTMRLLARTRKFAKHPYCGDGVGLAGDVGGEVSSERGDSMTHTFFATFGHGQPGYPGYLEVTVEGAENMEEAAALARQRVTEATEGKWCGLYDSLEHMHELDRVFRGVA